MAEHITIRPADGTWVVRAGGAVLGESAGALELIEPGHDPVVYFPRADIATQFLEPSETTTTCPRKGAARYFSISTKSGALPDAAWSYETPKTGAERIAEHVAFHADKVTVEQL